jgi:hypothetical protein
MPLSYATYTGNGSTTTFSVPFPYILKAHVKLYFGYSLLDGSYTSLLAEGTNYTWSSATQVQLTTAPTVSQVLTIIRDTPDSSQLVPWQDGSNLIAGDLNTADLQNLYVVQEQQDRNDAGITQSTTAINTANAASTTATTAAASIGGKLDKTGGTMTGAIAMSANKITGLGDPTAAQDAVTKTYVDTSTAASVAAAAASATTATAQAASAATSASNAASAQAAAESARDSALAAYDNFDDRYLGAKASNPTVDNDGNPLAAGALYFNTTSQDMRIYTGSAWVSAYANGTTFLQLTGGTMTGNITFAGGQPTATTSAPNIVQLTDSTASTSTTTAATPNSVKSAYDLANTANNTANAALPKTGGTMTGAITFTAGQATPAVGAITSGSVSGITDLAVADGGTGASTASGARTNLELVIGTDVQAFDSNTTKLNVTQSFTKAQRGSPVALTDAATVAVDLSLGNFYTLTLGGNRTLGAPTNQTAGQSGVIVITQDGTGSRTLAYNSVWKFPSGTAPTLTTTASAVDVLAYYVESATRITARLLSDVK